MKPSNKTLLIVSAILIGLAVMCAPLAWNIWQLVNLFDAAVIDETRVVPRQQEAVAALLKKQVAMMRNDDQCVVCLMAIEADVRDEDIDHIVKLSTLEELYLGGNKLSPECLAALKRLPNLKCLNLVGIDLSNDGAEPLKRSGSSCHA